MLYASKPQTAGGPFRSPLGQVVFPGQRLTQRLAPPATCVNEVSYKALGFVPGVARQEGEIQPLDARTFKVGGWVGGWGGVGRGGWEGGGVGRGEGSLSSGRPPPAHHPPTPLTPPPQLVFPELDGKRKGGPPQRIIQLAYLDERVR